MSLATDTLDLSGPWHFAMGDECPSVFCESLDLPGSLQAQGFGDDVHVGTQWTGEIMDRSWFTEDRYARYREPGNIKIPFWLQPEKHWIGTAWYQKEIEIPPDWAGRRIFLTLERPHICSTAWLGEQETTTQSSLAAPHVHDFGIRVSPGRHLLKLRICNRLSVNVGTNSHSVTDHTQTNWNGVVGTITLSSSAPVWIEDLQVYPLPSLQTLRVDIAIGNQSELAGSGRLIVGEHTWNVEWNAAGGFFTFELPVPPDAARWDEFHPVLHSLTARLVGPDFEEARTVSYGLREWGVSDKQITLNGRKIFLRGTLECAVFPLTGYPAMDIEKWREIFQTCRDYGFNHIRFHSWCPPETAFQAADELGFYLQVECSSWANSTTGLGDGEAVDTWLYQEATAILKAFGNHPSFLLMAYGNEPGGSYTRYLADWVSHWKSVDPRRLHTSAGGWPALDENDFDNIPDPRLHLWAEGLRSRLNAFAPATDFDHRIHVLSSPRPIISHEIGEWCVYPNFDEIRSYTGLLKPRNFEIFRDSLEENHLGDLAGEFLHASGRLQILCYREEIEASLRTPGLAGYQLLQATDFPGQGTALVGWLDPFWKSKGYTTPEEFQRFQAPVVLLARMPQRIFSTADSFQADLEIANFGADELGPVAISWEIQSVAGDCLASGQWEVEKIPLGNGVSLGRLQVHLAEFPVPCKCRLIARLEGTAIANDWEFWVYGLKEILHANFAACPEVNIHRTGADWDAIAQQGGAHLVLVGGDRLASPSVGLGFAPIFWNTSWTRNQLPHTLGILCDPSHSAFAQFPTESHTNWQWWELIHQATTLDLDGLPPEVRPLIHVIDDWTKNRRLGLLLEARVGSASVLVCGMDLFTALPWRHAARQLQKSLRDYMKSPQFAPLYELSPAQMREVIARSLPS